MKRLGLVLLLTAALAGCTKDGKSTVRVPEFGANYENLNLPIRVYFEGLPSPAVSSINIAIGWWQQFLAASPLCENRVAFKLCQEALFEITDSRENAFITITENNALPLNVRSVMRLSRLESGEVLGCRIQLGPDWSQSALQSSMGSCIGLRTEEIMQGKGE